MSITTDQTTGVGAGRHCDLGGKNYLDEEVVEWEAETGLTMRIIGTNMPFETADIRFTLRSDSGDSTVITLSPQYVLKFGPLGKILDLLFVRRNYLDFVTLPTRIFHARIFTKRQVLECHLWI